MHLIKALQNVSTNQDDNKSHTKLTNCDPKHQIIQFLNKTNTETQQSKQNAYRHQHFLAFSMFHSDFGKTQNISSLNKST